MMKNYTITVNGVAYEVTVEETTGGAAPASMPAMPRPAAAPAPAAPAAAPAAAAPAAGGAAGANRIEAGAAGKVFKIRQGS